MDFEFAGGEISLRKRQGAHIPAERETGLPSLPIALRHTAFKFSNVIYQNGTQMISLGLPFLPA